MSKLDKIETSYKVPSDTLVVGKIHNLFYPCSTIFPRMDRYDSRQCVGGITQLPVLLFQLLTSLSSNLVITVMMLYTLCVTLPKNVDANVKY